MKTSFTSPFRSTDGSALIFHREMRFHTISMTCHLIPPPGFELMSKSCTSLRDHNSGRSTDWATAAAAQNWRLNIFLFFSSGIDDMFVIMQAFDNLNPSEKKSGDDAFNIGLAMRHAGVAITVTSITDVVVFGVGASTVSLFRQYYLRKRNFHTRFGSND